MKMKPSERNAIKASADQAQREISRLESLLMKSKKGTQPHLRLESMLEAARDKLRSAKSSLARTTQPN